MRTSSKKSASAVLRPGERVLAAIRTQPGGTATGTAIGGAIGAAVVGRRAAKAHANATDGSLAASWPAGRFALGLTDQRLLAFNFSAMGKPKDLQAELSLNQVAAVELGKRKIMNAVHLDFTDGSALEVECAKIEKVGDFVSAFQAAKAGMGS